jgi:hypothetical protein
MYRILALLKKYLLAILLLVVFFSCNSNQFLKNNIKFILVKSKVLPFRYIGSSYPLKDGNIIRSNFGTSTLSIFNSNFEKIDSIDYSKIIPIDQLNNFYANTKDSIYLINNKLRTIYLINHYGTVLNSWTLKNASIAHNDWQFFSNDTLYLRGYKKYNIDTFQNNKCELEIVLKSKSKIDTVLNKFPQYPERYFDGNNYGRFAEDWVSRIIVNNRIIYSFPIDEKLHVYNKNGNYIGAFNAKSDFIDKFYITPKEKKGDFQYTLKMYTCAPKYREIVFDAYRKLYYRIVEHALPLIKADGTAPNALDKTWSIVVLDESMNRLGKVKMPSNRYLLKILPTPLDSTLLMRRNHQKIIEYPFSIITL